MAIQVTGERVTTPHVDVNRDGEIYRFPKKISPFQTSSGISPSSYALINEAKFPNYPSNSAISMTQELGGHNHLNAHREASERGLTIPSPSLFLPHYVHVNEASEDRAVLYDASGNIVEGERLRDYSAKLNSNCFVHLNASFPKESEKGTGFLGLDLAVITGFDEEGKPEFSISPLEDCLEKNCWADLESLNSQGLPTKRSRIERYIPGKVIYFFEPYKDTAARFYADSDGVDLDCYGSPEGSGSRLGVFLCAEGAQ